MTAENIDYMAIDINSLNLFKNKGYWQFYMPGHPLAAPSSGCVMFHRHLMSVERGTWLKKEDRVTFLNGNREDCSLENLRVVSKRELGQRVAHFLEQKPEKIPEICLYCGKSFLPESAEVRQVYCSARCKAAGFLRGDK